MTALRSSYHTNRCKSIPQALTVYTGRVWGDGKPKGGGSGCGWETNPLKIQ